MSTYALGIYFFTFFFFFYIFIVTSDIFVFQGLQLQITRYSLTMKAKVTHLISMLDTSRYFWIRMTWSLITQRWASRLVTCVETISNVCSISTLLERSALEWRLSKRWNLLLQLSMKRRQQVKKRKRQKKTLSMGVGLPYLYHYMVCSKLPGTSKLKEIIFRLNQIRVALCLIFVHFMTGSNYPY